MEVIKLQKDTRLDIRLNSLIKKALQDAAEKQGVSLTEFVTLKLIEAASFDKKDLLKS